jgi:hypothetical protein
MMSRFHRASFALAIGSAMGLANGCGASGGAASPEVKVERFRETVFEEVGQMLRIREKDASRPPSSINDLAKYERGFPAGFRQVENGEVVLLLGAPVIEGSAEAVIAYEKNTPASGGYVLMQDGTTIKKMSSDEFRAASKAPGTPAPDPARAGNKRI